MVVGTERYLSLPVELEARPQLAFARESVSATD